SERAPHHVAREPWGEADGSVRSDRPDGGAHRARHSGRRSTQDRRRSGTAGRGHRFEPREDLLSSEARRHARVDRAPVPDIGRVDQTLNSALGWRSRHHGPASPRLPSRNLTMRLAGVGLLLLSGVALAGQPPYSSDRPPRDPKTALLSPGTGI